MKAELSLLKQNWGDCHAHWSQKPLTWTNPGMNKGFVMAKTLQCWYSYLHLTLHGNPSARKGIPLQYVSTGSRQKLRDAMLWLMQPPSESSSKDWRMPIVWLPTSMRMDHKHSLMQSPKIEKLNAVQQLTAMAIPPSTVNMMSNEENHCFQCQDQGHIAWNCPNIRCFKCDEYGHIVMDYPQRIPPLGIPANHHQPKPHRSHHAR